MKIFLAIAAILNWLFAAALFFAPEQFYAHGQPMTPLIAELAQINGTTLLGVGFINWLGRTADRQGHIAILVGNLVTQAASLGLGVSAVLSASDQTILPAIETGMSFHIVVGGSFAFFLWRTLMSTKRTAFELQSKW